MAADRLATVALGVAETDDGSVRVAGHGPERTYASVEAFLDTLPTALNQIAATSSSCIALHAGCVRSPSGEVLLLPAVSGSGKTTLTAALVQAGWDYGTDEAVGVREGGLEAVTYPKPLVLDSSSRLVLGLGPSRSPNAAPAELRADVEVLVDSAGPVGRVVLPRYEEGATAVLSDPLDPQEAVVALLEHALNLAPGGPAGPGGAVPAGRAGAGAAPRPWRRGPGRGPAVTPPVSASRGHPHAHPVGNEGQLVHATKRSRTGTPRRSSSAQGAGGRNSIRTPAGASPITSMSLLCSW